MRDLKNLHKILDSAHKECEEEGFKVFSETARKNARQIVDSVCGKFPDCQYDIYPTEEREIAIDSHFKKGRGILMLCDSQGSLAYFATFDGKNSRFRCDEIKKFSDEALRVFEEFDRTAPRA